MQASIEAINQNKSPIFSIGGYSVLELLGSGAFGSVYKVSMEPYPVLYGLVVHACNVHALTGQQAEF